MVPPVLEPGMLANAKRPGLPFQFLVTGHIQDSAGRKFESAQAASLFFHRDERGFTVFQRASAIEPNSSRGTKASPASLEHTSSQLTIGGGGGGGTPPLYWKVKICVLLKVNFSDINYREDNWLSNGEKPGRGVYVKVFNTTYSYVWDGYTGDGVGTDEDGCTPVFYTHLLTNWTIFVESRAKVRGNEIFVYHHPENEWLTTWARTVDLVPGPNPVSVLWESKESTTLAAATFALYQDAGSMTNKSYEFHTGALSNQNDWDPNTSETKIYLTDEGSRRKTTIVHEMGHRLLRHRLGLNYRNDTSYNAWPPCDTVDKGPLGHSMRSKEYSVGAFNEAFGYFYAAYVWNNHHETNAKLMQLGEVIDLETGAPYLKNNCTGPNSGYGNQMDWMRFFWRFITNSYSDVTPWFSDVLGIISLGSPVGQFTASDDLESGANLWAGGIWLARFRGKATLSGID
ncbi:MAG TPA: hypothetical protein VE422_10765 [Terriglobia bacterium]|nr:hypothetical protein [Terriglobia bacterium]